MKRKLIAKTFAGLEDVLAKELERLGAEDIEKGIRMVSFSGDKAMLYRANFCLRTAVKVLMPIKEFKAKNADEVYSEVKGIEWSEYMDNDSSFIVEAVVFSDEFRHSRFAAYRVKDAIADYFREKTGKRPNVSISNPDIRINIHIAENDVTISLDSSGESLHQRGYRVGSVKAPINEVLAAGMIMLTGWDGECDLIDPMCGSGTILVEAALIARNIYPGVFRKEFAFERWKDFDSDLFEAIYNDDSQEREFNHKIYGYDINRAAVFTAQENSKSAGVGDVVTVGQQDVRDFQQPAEKAVMITNPPYGERITTDDILGLYGDIGTVLKHSFVGNDAWILSYHEECFMRIGFRPSTRIILYNGSLECEFRKYQVFEGKLGDRRREGLDIKTDEDRLRNSKFKGHKRVQEQTDGEEDKDDGVYSKEPQLGRHNFKWGDRKPGYERDDDHYFKSKPFSRPYGKDKRDDRERPERPFRPRRDNDGERPAKDGFRPKRDNDGERPARDGFRPKRRDDDGRHRDSGKFDKGRGRKPFDKQDRRTDRKPGRLSFDSDGRPIKK